MARKKIKEGKKDDNIDFSIVKDYAKKFEKLEKKKKAEEEKKKAAEELKKPTEKKPTEKKPAEEEKKSRAERRLARQLANQQKAAANQQKAEEKAAAKQQKAEKRKKNKEENKNKNGGMLKKVAGGVLTLAIIGSFTVATVFGVLALNSKKENNNNKESNSEIVDVIDAPDSEPTKPNDSENIDIPDSEPQKPSDSGNTDIAKPDQNDEIVYSTKIDENAKNAVLLNLGISRNMADAQQCSSVEVLNYEEKGAKDGTKVAYVKTTKTNGQIEICPVTIDCAENTSTADAIINNHATVAENTYFKTFYEVDSLFSKEPELAGKVKEYLKLEDIAEGTQVYITKASKNDGKTEYSYMTVSNDGSEIETNKNKLSASEFKRDITEFYSALVGNTKTQESERTK